MKGELTTTELGVSAGCGNVPGGEDSRGRIPEDRCSVSPLAPRRKVQACCSCEQTASDSQQGFFVPGMSKGKLSKQLLGWSSLLKIISKKVTGESFALFLLLPGHPQLLSQSLTCHGGVRSAQGQLTLPVPPVLDGGSSLKCFRDLLKSLSPVHPLLACPWCRG